MLDIIIPVLNEEAVLKEKSSYFERLAKQARLIFVDGGSRDESKAIAGKFGRVVTSRAGRGWQS